MNSTFRRALGIGLACASVSSVEAHAQSCTNPFTRQVVGDVVDYRVTSDGTRAVFLADAEEDDRFDLFFAPTDGSTPPVKLNPTLPLDGRIDEYAISPDDAWVVILTDDQAKDELSLFSVPITGGTPVELDDADGVDLRVTEFQITADSARVVYFQRDYVAGTSALWGVDIAGGTPVRMTPELQPGDSMEEWTLSPASTHIVYTSYEGSGHWQALWAAPLDGSATRTRLNDLFPGGSSIKDFLVTPDGARVLYRCDLKSYQVDQLWTVRITGGINKRVNRILQVWGDVRAGYRITADGTEVLFAADVLVNEEDDIYRAPVDGSVLSVRMTDASVTGSATEPVLTAAKDRVVYRARPISFEYKLYSSPADGSGPPIELNGPMTPSGEVQSEFLIGANDRVVYRADQDLYDTYELYSVPADGSSGAVKLHPPHVFKEDVARYFKLSEDGQTVLFSTDHAGPEGVFHAYSVPIDGSAAMTRLNETGAVSSGSFETRGALAFFRAADDLIHGILELLARPLDASVPSWKLNGDLAIGPLDGGVGEYDLSPDTNAVSFLGSYDTGGGVYSSTAQVGACSYLAVSEIPSHYDLGSQCAISPDGDWVAYRAQEQIHDPYRLHVVSSLGGPTVEVSGTLPDPARIGEAVFTPDSEHILFEVDDNGAVALHCAPIDGMGPILVVATLEVGADLERLQITPDGSRVVYQARTNPPITSKLFSATLATVTTPIQLSGQTMSSSVDDDWLLTPDGTRALYRAYELSNARELYSVPVDGSQVAVRLNSPVPTGGLVQPSEYIRFSSDGQTVFYIASEEVNDRQDLFRVPLDGSAASTKLNGPLITGANVGSFDVFPDDTRVVYSANAWVLGNAELFVVSTDGSKSPTRVSQPLPVYAGFYGPAVDSTNQWIIALGDLDLDKQVSVYRIKADGTVQERVNNPILFAGGDLDFVLTPDKNMIVMFGNRALKTVNDLYAAPADGSAPFWRLNGGYSGNYTIETDWQLTADSSGVVYRSDETIRGSTELFFAPLDVAGPPWPLTRPPTPPPVHVGPVRKSVIKGTVTKSLGG